MELLVLLCKSDGTQELVTREVSDSYFDAAEPAQKDAIDTAASQ